MVELEAAWGGTRLTLHKAERPEGGGATAPAAEQSHENGKPAGELELVIITAPTVGRFWRGSAAGAPALVEKGQPVCAGQQVATIESLTAPVEVLSERAGGVEQILAEDGQAVGFGDPLVAIRPDHA